ncbi:MAG: DUF1311 domain-containing protein [Bacteroidetes bacterium]|nr:DUF1311 domain-containing protein [Bacteroidota bacterium]
MKYIAILLLSLTLAAKAVGQEVKEEFPIDKRLRECLDSTQHQTTAGMFDCAIRARQQWDKELNKNFNLLLGKLSVDEKEKLKIAQRNWISYRDKEIEFSKTIYLNMKGSMWRVVLADRQTELTKQRALELRVYYDNLP